MKRANIVFKLILIVFIISLLSCCQTLSPPRFFVLNNEPMRNSYSTGYLELQEVYDSDGQLYVGGWADVAKEGTFVMELKLLNPKGEQIYAYKKDVKSDSYKGQPYVSFWNNIHLDQDLIAKLSPGNITINIYCDYKPLITKEIKYTPGSIINKNVNQVVILPFYSSTKSTFRYEYKDQTLNTFAYAVTNEVKRIVPEVIPHYIAEQKLTNQDTEKCIDNPACRERLKEIFGEAIIIQGDANMPKYVDELRSLKIYVFNTKTGEVKEFKEVALCTEGGYITDCMRTMLKNILYKNGLLAYLRGL